MTEEEYTTQIAARNDEFRRRGFGGYVTISAGVAARGSCFATQVKYAVQADDRFTPETDPFGRHDFGVVAVAGIRVCWRIDEQAAERVLIIFTPPEF